MPEQAKPKKPKNIEELLQHFRESTSADHEKNIALYEAHIKTPNQAMIERQIVAPALEGDVNARIKGAYYTAAAEVDNLYKDNKVDVKDSAKLQRVLIAYAVGYFEHAMPSVLKALPAHLKETLGKLKAAQNVGKEEIQSLYEHIAHHFDTHVGAGQIEGVQGISGLEKAIKEQFGDEEEVTTDMLKQMLSGMVRGHKEGTFATLNASAQAAYITNLPQGVYASYLVEKIKKSGRQISPEREAQLHRQQAHILASDLHAPLVQRREDDVKYRKYGFHLNKTK